MKSVVLMNIKILKNSAAAAIVAVIFVLLGCAVEKGNIYEKDGKTYGKTGGIFKSQWDDYYLKGLSYMDGSYWEDAVDDFNKAINKRSDDQRRTRTYGLHFIDYFPNRELGIALFNLDRFEKAIRCLELSLSFVETSRAKFYLDKAREAWLRKNSLDRKSPEVAVQFPPAEYTTSDLSIPIKVTAKDNYFVSNIIVNGKDNPLELSQTVAKFEEEYLLHSGQNFITVQSEDILGKRSLPVTVKINVDRQGPVLLISAEKEKGGGMRITGAVYDASGLTTAVFNKRKINFSPSKIVYIDERIERGRRLQYELEDSVGNRTSGFLEVFCDDQNKKTPYVYIEGLKNGQTAYLDELNVQGSACFKGSLKQLIINGYPLLFDEDEDLSSFMKVLKEKKGNYAAFSKKLRLRNGKNRIRASFFDNTGDEFNRVVFITKKEQIVKQIVSRMSIAVLPFEETRIKNGRDKQYVGAVLETAFKAQERFNILPGIEVENILVKRAADKEKFNGKWAADLGMMMDVDAVMIGEISRSDRSVEINSRFIDPKTGSVLAEKDVYWECSSFSGYRQKVDMLAGKFKKHFPMLESEILGMKKGKAVIGVGKDQSVKKRMSFIVYNGGNTILNDDNTDCLGSDTVVSGLLSLEKISPASSLAGILKTFDGLTLKAGDKVIAK